MPSWIKENQVFVIMPFSGDGMDEAYDAIEQACKSHGMTALRVDKVINAGIVMRKIYKLILESEFIICDLSHERPNVYFELGFAVGVGNLSSDILLIANEDTKLHFDVAPYDVKFYRSKEELVSLVGASLPKMRATSPGQLRRWGIQLMRKFTLRSLDA